MSRTRKIKDMIRSSNTTIKFSNTNKKDALTLFVSEYQRVTSLFVDELWNTRDIPKLIPKDITDKIKDQTWLSARAVQCSAKQASSIVRGTKKKNSQRKWRHKKLLEEGKIANAKRLMSIIEKHKESKPALDTICPELDSRFVKIDLDNETSFDGWLTLTSLGDRLKLELPFKRTRHMNRLMKRGSLKSGVRLLENSLCLLFDLPDRPKKSRGHTIGLDIGVKKVFVTSDGQRSTHDVHGWDLTNIQHRLSRRKKGSKRFQRAQMHRSNFVNWSINQLNLKDTRELRVEDIKDLRKNKRTSRFLTHWTYSEIYDKLSRACEESGVQMTRVSPAFTSQRCSSCGWTQETNRNEEEFQCKLCGFATDADRNASVNIGLDLPPIKRRERSSFDSKTGFFWEMMSEEPIVPHVQRARSS